MVVSPNGLIVTSVIVVSSATRRLIVVFVIVVSLDIQPALYIKKGEGCNEPQQRRLVHLAFGVGHVLTRAAADNAVGKLGATVGADAGNSVGDTAAAPGLTGHGADTAGVSVAAAVLLTLADRRLHLWLL